MSVSKLAILTSLVIAAATTGASAPSAAATKDRHFTLVALHHIEGETKAGLFFKEDLARGKKIVGGSVGVCLFAGLKDGDPVPCTITVVLTDGTLRVRGKLVPNATRQHLTIVGGTDAYAGASGAVNSTSLNGGRSKLVFAIH